MTAHLHDSLAAFISQNEIPARQRFDLTLLVNKCLTVNFRAPAAALQALLPGCLTAEEIRDSGMGMLSVCGWDYWITRLGFLPLPEIHCKALSFRIAVTFRRSAGIIRAFYPLRTMTTVPIGKWPNGRERRDVPQLDLEDSGEFYGLSRQSRDPLQRDYLEGDMKTVSKAGAAGSIFHDINEAARFILAHEGSCAYDAGKKQLLFQPIIYPPWEICFCHEFQHRFPWLQHLCADAGIQIIADSALFSEEAVQVWKKNRFLAPAALTRPALNTAAVGALQG